VAALWLTCQVGAFAASPFVLCHDHNVMSRMPAKHECGAMCPMHHHGQQPSQTATHEHHHHDSTEPSAPQSGTPHSGTPSVACRCTVSDAALAGLTLEAGILPLAFTLSDEIISTGVVVSDYAAPTRQQLPETPPPRA
jgi:hypothetical protein